MNNRDDRLILIAFADPNAFHANGSAASRDPHRFELSKYAAHARVAEDAGFDAIFRPDFLGFDPSKGTAHARSGFEPLTLLTALSQHTRRLGLIATESTSFNEPYNVARWFTSLDHLSAGRSGWNVVTSYNGEANYGAGGLTPLADRYRRADEFLEVTYRLWSGWQEGALVSSHEGHRIDPSRIVPTAFEGEFFRVAEALDLPPGPQGRPVIVQAGASDEGLSFAAKHAEIVFTAAPHIDDAIAFSTDLKRRVIEHGRDPGDLKILPGLNVFLADTVSEAIEIHRSQFTDRNLVAYRNKVVREAPLFRISELDLDEVIPASAVPSLDELGRSERRRSRGVLLHRYLDRPGITLRDFLIDTYEFGHLLLVGTPDSVAEEIVTWFDRGASDGFVLKGGNSFARIAEDIVPRLRDRGVLRPAPDDGRSFREALRSR